MKTTANNPIDIDAIASKCVSEYTPAEMQAAKECLLYFRLLLAVHAY
jgi:hypothetical protein